MKLLIFIVLFIFFIGCDNKSDNYNKLSTNKLSEKLETNTIEDKLYFNFDYKKSQKDSTITYKGAQLNKDWLKIVGQDSNQIFLSCFNKDSLKNKLYAINLKDFYFSIYHVFPTSWQIHEIYAAKKLALISVPDSLYFVSLIDYSISDTYYLPDIDEICLTKENQFFYSNSKNYNTYLYSDTTKRIEGTLISKMNYGNYIYIYDQYNEYESTYSPTGRINEYNYVDNSGYYIFDYLALGGAFFVLEDKVFIITKEDEYSSYLVDLNHGFEIKIDDYIPDMIKLQRCYSSIIFNKDQLIFFGCNGYLLGVDYHSLQKSAL